MGKQSRVFATEFQDLLSEDAIYDNSKWGKLWMVAGAEHRQWALRLLIYAVLNAACNYWRRIGAVCEDFPLLIIRLVEEDMDVASTLRMSIAKKLLSTPDCCLTRPFDDFTVKFKKRHLRAL